MDAMREGTTRGMMMDLSMLRKSSPMYFTYIASLLVQGSSLEDLRPSPSPIPERENNYESNAGVIKKQLVILFTSLISDSS